MAPNPFLSTQKSSDSVPAVLHPLVLLSISDHITRHTLRKQPGPVVGALLGQQNGRQVTLEHTFDFVVGTNDEGDAQFSQVWFGDRLEQMRTVHKDRQLDLVGWYTVLSHDGPTPHILQVHQQILPLCSESTAAVLLAFHPEDLAAPSVGGKLPLTIYETNFEPDEEGAVAAARRGKATATATADSSTDKEMTDVGEEPSATAAKPAAGTHMVIKFREIPYTVETGDAEMISIDFVAGGVANASAGERTSPSSAAAGTATANATAASAGSSSSRDRAVAIEAGTKGKRRLVAAETTAVEAGSDAAAAGAAAGAGAPEGTGLSREDEELIATLTTRANAIRMLHARLQLLTKYLEGVEAVESVEGGGQADTADQANPTGVAVSLPILRSIQALVRRLPLVVPPPVNGGFEEERQREANDVELVSGLLDDLMQGISSVRQVSSKYGVLDQVRVSRNQRLHGREDMSVGEGSSAHYSMLM